MNFIKKNINKDKVIIFLMLAIIFIILAIQHSFINMYFDDFKNASLSYGYTVPNVDGTNYSIAQILEWAYWIFFNWGGRLLYAVAFLIPLLKNGISAFMIVQAFIVTLIIFYSYKITDLYMENGEYKIIRLIILFLCYGLIEREFVVNGLYWASASVLYIWPLLPLIMFIYYYIQICRMNKNNKHVSKVRIAVLIILNLFVVLSQEQFCVALIGFLLFYALIDHKDQIRNYIKVDGTLMFVALIGTAVILLAPGNFARMTENADFNSLSIIDKAIRNYPLILDLIFSAEMRNYNYLLLFICTCFSMKLFKKNRLAVISVVVSILGIVFIFISGKLDLNDGTVIMLVRTIIEINILIAYSLYFYYYHELSSSAILYAAGGSMLCLIMAPYIVYRTLFIYLFFVFILITIGMISSLKWISNMLNFKGVLITGYVLVITLFGYRSIENSYIITKGYYLNDYYFRYNDNALRQYRYIEGDGTNKIRLFLPETNYTGVMPYHNGFEHVNNWMKEYYDIPENIEIVWESVSSPYQ